MASLSLSSPFFIKKIPFFQKKFLGGSVCLFVFSGLINCCHPIGLEMNRYIPSKKKDKKKDEEIDEGDDNESLSKGPQTEFQS